MNISSITLENMNSTEKAVFNSFNFDRKHELYICERTFTSSRSYNFVSLESDWLELVSEDKIVFKKELREKDIKKIIHNIDIDYHYFFTEIGNITYEAEKGKRTFEGRLCLVITHSGDLSDGVEVRLVKEDSILAGIRPEAHQVKDINFGTLTKAVR